MTRCERPTLRPGLRLLDRGGDELQLGAHHPTAMVLAGLSAADREVVMALDGTRSRAAASTSLALWSVTSPASTWRLTFSRSS